jgi:hypothetical protein
VDAVADFAVGEAVLVELDGEPDNFLVRTVRLLHQRQPPDTHSPLFDEVNRFGETRLEEVTAASLQFWVGDCCEHCTPDARRLRFEGVTTIRGLDEDYDWDNPLFRLASMLEIGEHDLLVPAGSTAFCIVTSHGNGPDGPRVFVVAAGLQVFRRGE